ncbi:MAG: GGDEF domain-containing protein [Thioalkalispiraceae bacterium]|jgi:diguanylate cyclase (GGDEF)-like protein
MYNTISRTLIKKSAFLIIVAIAILTVTSLFYMWQLNRNIEQLENQYDHRIELIFRMSQVARDRTFDVFFMYLSDDVWVRDDSFMRFNKRALEFIQLRDELLKTSPSASLRTEIEKLLSIIKVTQPLQEDITGYLYESEREKANPVLIEKDLPLESKLYKQFDRLLVTAINEADEVKSILEDKYRKTIYIILVFSVLVIAFIVIVMMFSMKKIHAHEMTISWDAAHDHLTRAYNRRWLVDYWLSDKRKLKQHEQHAVLYIDLDNFKPVNDKYGHSTGDKVLVDVVEILGKCVRKNDIIVRMGGDEFVVLLENCSSTKASDIAASIMDSLSDYHLQLDTAVISGLSCSIGIGFINRETSWQAALDIADQECNKVKHAGKSAISLYTG